MSQSKIHHSRRFFPSGNHRYYPPKSSPNSPKSLSQSPIMHPLHLRRNRLHSLPNPLPIPNCTHLDLYDNLLDEFPNCLFQAESLSSLDLSFNRLSCLPSPRLLPKKIHILYASCNRLVDVDEFTSSDQFKLLEFGGNRISQIPLAWNCSQ